MLASNHGERLTITECANAELPAITTPECDLVLDHIRNESLAGINIDQVETAINTLFEDRFIELGP